MKSTPKDELRTWKEPGKTWKDCIVLSRVPSFVTYYSVDAWWILRSAAEGKHCDNEAEAN